MKFNSLEVSNFGPVKSGTIGSEKIMVFFGANNTGKSMVARLVRCGHSFRTCELHRKVRDNAKR